MFAVYILPSLKERDYSKHFMLLVSPKVRGSLDFNKPGAVLPYGLISRALKGFLQMKPKAISMLV